MDALFISTRLEMHDGTLLDCVECGALAGRVIEYNPDLWDLEEQNFDPEDWQVRAYPGHPESACFRSEAASLSEVFGAWLRPGTGE